jgi:SAM-dependent methyltransferase
VAPGAAFVCADAARPLPLADGVASAALCADALQHLHDKRLVVDELARVAGDGPLLFTSVGNLLVGEPDGEEMTPEGYGALFDPQPWRVRSEADLLDAYLAGRGPDLRVSSDPEALASSRFLYYVVDPSEAMLREHPAFTTWPHAVGEVTLNPLYEREGERSVLRWPSPWFETENGGLRAYMPAEVDPDETPSADLLAGAALVGLPKRYARPEGRPWTVAANRALLRFIRRLRTPAVAAGQGDGGAARPGGT